MAWRWLVIVCLMGLAACLGAEREPSPELDSLALPDQADVELCEALDECSPATEVSACARRYACARQLWRDEIVDDVYACIAERPCSDPDPATSCLQALAVEKTTAERRFEAVESDLERDCGTLLEVPPGQNDEVYELLTGCIENNESCDAVSACAIHSFEALGEELCGSTVTASRQATTPSARSLAMASES